MKPYNDMTYDEQEQWLNWKEAESCPKCGGHREVPDKEAATEVSPIGWVTCPACNGTGRA